MLTALLVGHKSNLEFVKKLNKIMNEDNRKIAPVVDFNEKPFYNIDDIKKILPHREPFIFIDEIRDLGEDYIVGVKYVKKDEDYYYEIILESWSIQEEEIDAESFSFQLSIK